MTDDRELRRIDPVGRTTIVAELGSNHDRRWDHAVELLDIAARIGVDAVKLQDFHGSALASSRFPQLREAFERVQLPNGWVADLAHAARERGVLLFTTAFDEQGVQSAVELGLSMIKIASGDLTFHRLLRSAAQSSLPIVISTGAATMSEVEAAVGALRGAEAHEITVLHCVSAYPTAVSDFDLGGMLALRAHFPGLRVGVSDHSSGSVVPLAAVTLGGRFIEKHLTPDRSRQGPDHSYALEPAEFAELVRDVRQLEASLSSPISKQPKEQELSERFWARRGLYAAHPLLEGVQLEQSDLVALRPCAGIGAEYEQAVLGQKLKRPLQDGEELRWTDL